MTTTSTELLYDMASQLNAIQTIQDWNILQSLGFTVCFSRYLMMTFNNKGKIKFKKSQKLYGIKLNLRV